MSNESKISSQFIATFATQIFSFFVATVTGILVTRALGPDNKGLYFLAFSLSILVMVIVKSSIEVAGTYFTGKEGYAVTSLPGNYLIASLITSLVSYGVFWLFWTPLRTAIFPNLPLNYVLIALAAVPFHLIVLYYASIFMVLGRVGSYNKLFIFQNVLTTALLAIVTLGLHYGAAGALLSWAIGIAVTAIVAMVQIHVIVRPHYRFEPVFLRKLFVFGLKGHVGEIIDFLINRTDTFFINFFLGAASVGFYSVALSAELLWYIPNSIISILYPRFSNHTGDTLALAKQACRSTLFLTAIGGIGLMAVASPFIRLAFGPVFEPGIVPMIILIPGIASLSISKTLKIFLSSQGKPLPATYASIAAFAINIVLNLILIPRFGLRGGAVAVSVSYFFYAGFIYWQFSKMYHATARQTLLITKDDVQTIWKMLLPSRFIKSA
jgi:O-antigen/teichoic acid export membrane protein